MLLFEQHYSDPGSQRCLTENLCELFPNPKEIPLILSVGSDRSILDSLGPMTGSLLKDKNPKFPIHGTLDRPLDAKSLTLELQRVRFLRLNQVELAIDASMGSTAELGLIRLRKGPLFPGRALAKDLPTIGQFCITGIVAAKNGLRPGFDNGSLAPVYAMARVISNSIIDWYQIINNK